MSLLEGQKVTKFAKDWMREYFTLIGDDLNRVITDGKLLGQILALPDQLDIDDGGGLRVKGKDGERILRALEFGSSVMGVPRLSILNPLRAAITAELDKEIKQFK